MKYNDLREWQQEDEVDERQRDDEEDYGEECNPDFLGVCSCGENLYTRYSSVSKEFVMCSHCPHCGRIAAIDDGRQ